MARLETSTAKMVLLGGESLPTTCGAMRTEPRPPEGLLGFYERHMVVTGASVVTDRHI